MIYRTVDFQSNCTLDQYNWTIPSTFNTTDPQYQFGIFNASTKRGTDGIPLFGFMSWSPPFYVYNKTTSAATSPLSPAFTQSAMGDVGTTTSSVTSTSLTSTQALPASSIPASDSLSTGAKTGIGVGVTIGVIALAVPALLFFFRRRNTTSKKILAPASAPVPAPIPAPGIKLVSEKDNSQIYELDGIVQR
ncbi:hypothetical protein BGW36DRAFT_204425 [Talaromyces proteolyticus]|uniref:Mid2 domain-containing protein n=1 Tax=Talaromyces proteolyticus TaxID=1131652 RepID=A0AAD4KNQ3_9EURO|nr:uncharacterized protein BGW36DRAFT_204425 [Talaromyces proteolyticus]KAH8695559.1 hypothetical protein BGW36DRAFT_204425 [Talaromyces proteolyticus]